MASKSLSVKDAIAGILVLECRPFSSFINATHSLKLRRAARRKSGATLVMPCPSGPWHDLQLRSNATCTFSGITGSSSEVGAAAPDGVTLAVAFPEVVSVGVEPD